MNDKLASPESGADDRPRRASFKVNELFRLARLGIGGSTSPGETCNTGCVTETSVARIGFQLIWRAQDAVRTLIDVSDEFMN